MPRFLGILLMCLAVQTGSGSFAGSADAITHFDGTSGTDAMYWAVTIPTDRGTLSISAAKVVGKKKIYPTPESPEMPITAEALPPRYNERNELTYDVKPGQNEKDWDLKGK